MKYKVLRKLKEVHYSDDSDDRSINSNSINWENKKYFRTH